MSAKEIKKIVTNVRRLKHDVSGLCPYCKGYIRIRYSQKQCERCKGQIIWPNEI